MGSDIKTIVWFRRDLRIEDNPALAAAARDGSVFLVYIWCPKEEGQFYPGRVSRWWLKQSLIHLQQSLRAIGAPLKLIKAESTLDALLDCINSVGATKVVYNHLYDPISLVRDHNIKQKLGEMGITVQSYNGDLLYEPWEVYDDEGLAFTTFEPYWNKCLSLQMDFVSESHPSQLIPAAGKIETCSIEELGLENETEKTSNALLGRGWSPGWAYANKALTEFVETHMKEYSKSRLRVAGNATSLLSPYLHFGELSVRKVFNLVRTKQILFGEDNTSVFLKAIGMRDYSRYICFNFPFTHERSLLGNLKHFPWNADQNLFKAWRQGRTGYPLVDAGMRELWATGWIHNRIRVIVSSFFVKFLLLPWQWGMKYFWDTLLDADLESDILGWQYISGSLPDGHDLERMDSPQVQGFKFDPEGEYVRNWLPELAKMPPDWIHHPWDAPFSVLVSAGVELGQNYPVPVIDIDTARDRLAEAIRTMREKDLASKTGSSDGANEEVVDNTDSLARSTIPKVVLKEKVLSSTISSNDQKVPTRQNFKEGISNRKRPNNTEDNRPVQIHDKLKEANKTSRVDDEFCSTAESPAAKKPSTSVNTFSVPSYSSSSSPPDKLKAFQDADSSDTEQDSSKKGGMKEQQK
ncbi:cryptochrome-1 [Impatiens glandulifera]|uniref:cryptochrome-1 n=1 Tax=Impatiens glandulifera TaxID=253017 RepID=UPI001FB103E4|nr:cryptochrome-1 [Impatiens glandulifera]XP_047321303.1 cryptochrome-1 [Impatiens glandulifera]